jgi:hypothetical protein
MGYERQTHDLFGRRCKEDFLFRLFLRVIQRSSPFSTCCCNISSGNESNCQSYVHVSFAIRIHLLAFYSISEGGN